MLPLPLGYAAILLFAFEQICLGAIDRNRTCNLMITNHLLFQLSYDGIFVIQDGFEPSTASLENSCSIQLSYRTVVGLSGLEPEVFCAKSRRVANYTTSQWSAPIFMCTIQNVAEVNCVCGKQK
jgi:hypothetical protein